MNPALFSRDILYPTESLYEPGSVHIEVLNPNRKDRVPVVIESKSVHSPIKFIDSILRIMQGDIFDRIFIDLKKNASLYIKVNDTLGQEYAGYNFILVSFNGDKIEYKGIDEVDT